MTCPPFTMYARSQMSRVFPDVVIGDEYADSALRKVTDLVLDVGDGNRIDSGKGLVEQHERGLDCERPGDLDAATLSTRQLFAGGGLDVLQAKLIQKSVDELAPRLLAQVTA